MKFNDVIKIIFDYSVTLVAFVVTLPLFLLICLLIRLDSKGPAIFKQKRVGLNGKVFKVLKFRTMVENAERIGLGMAVAENDSRITRIGKLLRETTLDELPQFINILKGEMSLVGPRPLPLYEGNNENIKKMWQKRISVKPGLVSLVDAKGRNSVPWEKRFEYDAWYVDNHNFFSDIKILVTVFLVVLSRKGIYDKGGVNKPPQ